MKKLIQKYLLLIDMIIDNPRLLAGNQLNILKVEKLICQAIQFSLKLNPLHTEMILFFIFTLLKYIQYNCNLYEIFELSKFVCLFHEKMLRTS